MSVIEIVEEIPRLSEQELLMLSEALQDAQDVADATRALAEPGENKSLAEWKKERGL